MLQHYPTDHSGGARRTPYCRGGFRPMFYRARHPSVAMILIFSVAMLSCVLSLALTPLCRAVSLRFGIVDRPDRTRKFHSHPIPRVGGVAIFVALAVSMGVLALLEPAAKLQALDWGDVTRSLPAVILIFITGLLDDLMA